MSPSKQTILITNPISSVGYLINAFKQAGYAVVAFATSLQDSDYFNYQQLPFAKIIISKKNLIDDISLLRSLHKLDIKAGMIGGEIDIEYTEKLLFALFPSSANDPQSSPYRYNKFIMNERLSACHIAAIKQTIIPRDLSTTSKIKKSVAFYQQNQQHVVIKPCHGSAGSSGVLSPNNPEQIRHYYHQDKPALFSEEDTLLQEKLSGIEYYIDTASYQGQHRIVGIGKYYKKEINGIFEASYVDAVNIFDGSEESQALADYAIACLNALKFENGLSHIEVMKTAKGLRLIELNPRISGTKGYHNIMHKHCYHTDQIDTYLSMMEKRPVVKRTDKKHRRFFYFRNKKGPYHQIETTAISKLTSYFTHTILCPSMTSIPQQPCLVTVSMLVLLEHDDQTQLENDSEQLFLFEQAGSLLR